MSDIVQRDWDRVQEELSDQDFGNAFYSEIQRAAPEFLCLFVRPKRLQYNTFVEFMEMLVAFSLDPDDFYQQVKPLAIRHIKYGVKADYVKYFGTVVHRVLEGALGDAYDEESRAAWSYVWTSVSRCIADCLNVGSNLVTVALVTGEVEELRRALSLAPRGQRADWITRVQIHDSVVSPLYWAVKDGKLDMARLMIRDLLALRADREAYYYGYDKLWAVHPDLVAVLCNLCPGLLEDVFDGMLWHSAQVEAGRVRVNYYMRELYGDPDVYPDAWATPFGVLALEGPTTLFVHPLVGKVLDIKWRAFARKWFLIQEGWYTLILILFELAFVVLDPRACGGPAQLRIAVGTLGAVTAAGQAALVVGQVRAGQVGMVRVAGVPLTLPRWLHKPWNCQRWISMCLLTFLALDDPCLFPARTARSSAAAAAAAAAAANGTATSADMDLDDVDVPCALVALLLWMGTLQFFTMSPQLSALTFTVGTMIADVSRVLVVLLALIFAFATALACVESDQAVFSTYGTTLLSLARYILTLDPPQFDTSRAVGTIFLVLFVLLSSIGMLNILIAQLTQTYNELSRLTHGYAMLHRAHLAIEVESTLSLRKRKKLWDKMALYEPLEFDQGYVGPAGGVQALEPASIMQSSKYKRDRVIRAKGDASPMLPWPVAPTRPDEDGLNPEDQPGPDQVDDSVSNRG